MSDFLTEDKVKLLKKTHWKGAHEEDILLAIEKLNQIQIEPFSGMVHFQKRRNKKLNRDVMTVQVSIDGARYMAERTNQYAGQTPQEWCGKDGKWVDVWVSQDPPVAARCGVYRKGFDHPVYAVAKFESYAVGGSYGLGQFWKKMPDLMISKCAEALAYRKAFPDTFAGVYTNEEMHQATSKKEAKEVVKSVGQLVEFNIAVSNAKTLSDLKKLKPPKGLSDADLESARELYRIQKLLLENEGINPETGEVSQGEQSNLPI